MIRSRDRVCLDSKLINWKGMLPAVLLLGKSMMKRQAIKIKSAESVRIPLRASQAGTYSLHVRIRENFPWCQERSGRLSFRASQYHQAFK